MVYDIATVNLLIGIAITILTGIFTKFCLPAKDEMDKKLRASIVVAVAFVFTLCITFAYYYALSKNIISYAFIEQAITYLFTAVGAFEVIYKQVIKPALVQAGLAKDE